MKRVIVTAASWLAMIAVLGCDSSTSTTIVAPGAEQSDSASDSPAAINVVAIPNNASPATEAMDGYLLLAPLRSPDTLLLNSNFEVVHRWASDYPPSGTAYLMENGDLLRGARNPEFKDFRGGGIGFRIERYSWDGELVWHFQYANDEHCLHHDIATLPNGNILMIAWERKSKEEAIEQGRDPQLLGDDLWPDHVIEVEPEGTTGGKIVWEWHMWDHLVQDFDREKPNYGVIYEHPELIDLNNIGSTPPATPEELRKLRAVGYTGGGDDDEDNRRVGADWLHTNAINYNAELDQIALSAKHFSEVWIIDHSTTTEEAASHRGGKHGKGGDLLYRWGNPWSYKSGTIEDKMLFDQHDVRWISPGLPGAGHIMAFNNGQGRDYSSIVEIKTPMNDDGEYILDDEGRFGPNELIWEYTAKDKKDFFSGFISGATRLRNGNTLICEGATGRYFEVNSAGEILFEHVNTFGGELDMEGHPSDAESEARKILQDGEGTRSFVENNALFRVTKYAPDFDGLADKSLVALGDQPVPFSTLVEQMVAKLKAEEPDKATNETESVTPDADQATAEPNAESAAESDN